MEGRSPDCRVRRTRMRLRAALTQLTREKSLREISVRELTELAGINRCTFYLHYHDIFELYEQVQREISEEIGAILRAHPPCEAREQPRLLLCSLYDYFTQNADICAALLDRCGDTTLFNYFMELMREHFLKFWLIYGALGQESMSFDYPFAYAAFGCAGLVQEWFHSGMKESPAEMAALTERLMLRGLGEFDTRPDADKPAATNGKEIH